MLSVLIIEDEKPAADYLALQLKKIDEELDIIARLPTVRESVEWLSMNTPDLVFMDIHLADGNAFTIFDRVDVRCPVIFTTAYDQYAIKAFKVNSIDYLLKPIMEDELRKSLKKFKEFSRSHGPESFDISSIIRAINRKKDFQQRFMVYSGEKIRAVKANEVAYFQIIEKNTFLVTFDKHSYGLDYSLDKLENMVDPDVFFRINRKQLINLEAVQTMFQLSGSRIKIVLDPPPDEDAIVSFHRVSAFKKWLNR